MEQSKMIIKRNLLSGENMEYSDSHPDWICFAVRFVFQYG